MQRRAFIIFYKDDFSWVFVGRDDPVSTPHSARPGPGSGSGGRPGAAPSSSRSRGIRWAAARRPVELSFSRADPHQNILAEPRAIWKMIHLTSGEPEFLYLCAWKRCRGCSLSLCRLRHTRIRGRPVRQFVFEVLWGFLASADKQFALSRFDKQESRRLSD